VKRGEPLSEEAGVLLDPILDHLRAVAHRPQVGVDALNHGRRGMAQLAAHGVNRDRCPPVEGLEPGGTIGVTEGLGPHRPAILSSEAATPARAHPKLAHGGRTRAFGTVAALTARFGRS
jgi:hypothetical protein